MSRILTSQPQRRSRTACRAAKKTAATYVTNMRSDSTVSTALVASEGLAVVELPGIMPKMPLRRKHAAAAMVIQG
jgi:hypothetical protein